LKLLFLACVAIIVTCRLPTCDAQWLGYSTVARPAAVGVGLAVLAATPCIDKQWTPLEDKRSPRKQGSSVTAPCPSCGRLNSVRTGFVRRCEQKALKNTPALGRSYERNRNRTRSKVAPDILKGAAFRTVAPVDYSIHMDGPVGANWCKQAASRISGRRTFTSERRGFRISSDNHSRIPRRWHISTTTPSMQSNPAHREIRKTTRQAPHPMAQNGRRIHNPCDSTLSCKRRHNTCGPN